MAGSLQEFVHAYPATSKAFTVAAIANDLVLVWVESNGGSSHATATDDGSGGSNTYVEQGFLKASGSNANITCLLATVAHTGTLTVTVSALSDGGISCYLLRDYNGTADDVQFIDGFTTANPLTVSLALGATGAIFTAWGNEVSNHYTSFTESQTEDNHDSGHYDAHGHKLALASGTYSPGVNASSINNGDIIMAIALRDSGGGGTVIGAPFFQEFVARAGG